MNIQSFILISVLTLFSGAAAAGTDHSHDPVTQQQAEQVATQIVSTMVKQGVIEESWDGTAVQVSEQKVFSGRTEWVVSYRNDAVSDPSKRTLYIFLTLTGDYIAANYTGL